jgi:hypothetical protein
MVTVGMLTVPELTASGTAAMVPPLPSTTKPVEGSPINRPSLPVRVYVVEPENCNVLAEANVDAKTTRLKATTPRITLYLLLIADSPTPQDC